MSTLSKEFSRVVFSLISREKSMGDDDDEYADLFGEAPASEPVEEVKAPEPT